MKHTHTVFNIFCTGQNLVSNPVVMLSNKAYKTNYQLFSLSAINSARSHCETNHKAEHNEVSILNNTSNRHTYESQRLLSTLCKKVFVRKKSNFKCKFNTFLVIAQH